MVTVDFRSDLRIGIHTEQQLGPIANYPIILNRAQRRIIVCPQDSLSEKVLVIVPDRKAQIGLVAKHLCIFCGKPKAPCSRKTEMAFGRLSARHAQAMPIAQRISAECFRKVCI